MDALNAIRSERARQLAAGYDAEHDAAYINGELSRVATACLLLADFDGRQTTITETLARDLAERISPEWPFIWESQSRLTRLIKAAALVAAEIERLLPVDPDLAPDDRVHSIIADSICAFCRTTGNVGRIANPALRLQVIELLADYAAILAEQMAQERGRAVQCLQTLLPSKP